MALRLRYSDSLFNAGSYSIVHNGDEYIVDPVLFLKYSRKFATLFNFNENHIEVNDDYDKRSFDLFVDACQCKEVQIAGPESVNLLLLAEHWEATTLVTKIENIIKTTIPAKDILEMYNKFLGTDFPIERLEGIMTACLPRYINEPLFPHLPFEVLDRIIHGSRAKIGALDIVKLCYAVAEQHGLISVSVIGNTSFDDLPSDELQDLVQLFYNCPNEGLAQFFQAMSKLLGQVVSGADSATQFEVAWRNGENGNWNQAYDFFQYLRKLQKDQIEQEEGPEAAERAEQTATTTAFLKIAADKGNYIAQYEYSKFLQERAQTEEDRQVALNYMIQSAAESNSDAVTALKTQFPIPLVPTNMKQYVFSAYTLQNLLLNLNRRNIQNSKTAIFALIFGTERDGITALTSNILRAVLIRQRSMDLYAELVHFLISVAQEGQNNYALLRGSIFQHIMEVMNVEQPGPKQFHLMRFLYLCLRIGIFKDDELAENLVNFMTQQKLELSNLIIFYYFAPLLEQRFKPTFDHMTTFMLRLSEGLMGNLNPIFVDFKDNITLLKKNNWELFYKKRSQPSYSTELGAAIANDNLAEFERLSRQEGFDFNAKIPNDVYDLGIDNTDEITPLQYACIQGSQVIFTFLLQRGYVDTHDIHIFSIIAAIIGGNQFICNFIVKQMKSKADLFRLAAEFQNIVLLSNMFRQGWPISEAAEDDGRTALHLATERGLPDVVKILLSLDGMDLNKKDIAGYTALHIAAENNDIDLVKILTVCRGIVLDCRTAENLLPYDLATAPDVKAILKKK